MIINFKHSKRVKSYKSIYVVSIKTIKIKKSILFLIFLICLIFLNPTENFESTNMITFKRLDNSLIKNITSKKSKITIDELKNIFKTDKTINITVPTNYVVKVVYKLNDNRVSRTLKLTEGVHKIESNIDKRLKIRVNSTEFQQVLLNLFSNSIYALSKSDKFPKKIILSAAKKESTIQIIFADNGYGIAKEYQPNLFELLSTTKQSGMGLGLWLCEHIITRQNGKIWYEDNELGAKFIIELPQAN